MPLPQAKTISITAINNYTNSTEHLKKSIEHWIETKLLPKLINYVPEVYPKNKVVKGYVYADCPMLSCGNDEISQNRWREIYEEIIRPFGYEPVYINGIYCSVGIKWEYHFD